MKKRVYGRSHSQIINNFYTLVTIVIMTVVITLYSKYINPTKEKKFTPTFLPCQTTLQIEQKVSNPELLQEALMLFEKGNYMLDGGLLLLEDSPIDEKMISEKMESIFDNLIEVVAISNAQKFLNIKYEVIETPNVAPNISLRVSFRISANEVFRMYTHLDDSKLNEISQKVECIMNSFKHNAKQ